MNLPLESFTAHPNESERDGCFPLALLLETAHKKMHLNPNRLKQTWKIFPQPQPMLQGALVITNRNQSEILNGIAGVLAKLIRSIHPTRYWNGFELFDLLWSIGKGHLCE
ncbi:hypothetical protein ACO22_04559 [Paracoccidioides brasiliensis]|uniref:Uncharacterized protein n=1 Tax=Paracoccidioides brasiliensis TaxID=121759 RepID=A0A1D2JCR7_PARBR|nr:hypothetical protein ACO22_04559 [Paracoccidioides brasiliensis]